jgi:hypothetical protein
VRGLRSIGTAAALCGLGGLLVLLGASLPWAQLDLNSSPLTPGGVPESTFSFSSREVGYDAVPALGIVALAGAGALLAVGGARRRVVAAGMVAAGGAVALLCLRYQADSSLADIESRALGSRVGGYVIAGGGPTDAGYGALAATGGGLLVATAGVLGLTARSRKGLSRRFAAPTAATEAGPAAGDDDGTDIWNAIDRGEDPTEGFTQP